MIYIFETKIFCQIYVQFFCRMIYIFETKKFVLLRTRTIFLFDVITALWGDTLDKTKKKKESVTQKIKKYYIFLGCNHHLSIRFTTKLGKTENG